MSQSFTYLLVVLATVFWGANFNLSKPVVAEMTPLPAAALRFVIASILIVLLCALRKERTPWRLYLPRYVMLGIVGVGGFNVLFFIGMRTTTAVNGALIMALTPLLTSILAGLFLGEKLLLRQWLALPVAIAGVAVVIFGGGADFHLAPGDELILGAALAWACYTALSRRWMPKEVPGLANIAGVLTCGAVFLTLVALISGEQLTMPSFHAGSALMAMILGGTLLSYIFWNAGIARFGAARTGLFMNLVPVASMLISIATGIMPTGAQWLGGAIVIGAVLFASFP